MTVNAYSITWQKTSGDSTGNRCDLRNNLALSTKPDYNVQLARTTNRHTLQKVIFK